MIEYSDNYSDTSGSLWQFKRDEIKGDVDLTVNDNRIPNNLSSFKYKSSFITKRNGVKIVAPLKCLSNFWRLLEMPLINCKGELSLSWNPNFVLSNLVGDSTFTITDAKHYVPIITLSVENNAKLSKLLSEGFKRSVYLNKDKIIPNKTYDKDDHIRHCLIQVIKELKDCLFLLTEIVVVLIELQLILTEDTSSRELKLKTTTSKLMQETFMISQLMTQLSNTTKFTKFFYFEELQINCS